MKREISDRGAWEKNGCQGGDCGIVADIATPKTVKMPRIKSRLKAVKMPTLGGHKRQKNKKY